MAVDPLETRRTTALNAFADGASRTWTIGNGQNQFSFTVANPQIRTLNGKRVLSIDLTISRGVVVQFADRVNMPNPATGTRNTSGALQSNTELAAIRAQLLDTARAVTQNFTVIHDMRDGQGGFLGDTLSVRSSTADGTVESGPAVNWNSTRAGTGTSANTTNTTDTILATSAGGNYTTRQAFFDYDTSSLGSGATVSAAVFTLYGTSAAEADTDNTNLSARIYDWSSGGLTAADYRDGTAAAWSGLSVFATFDVGLWNQTNNTANDFTDAGSAASLVNKTGTTYIVVANDRIGSASAPTGSNQITTYFADTSGTSSDPLLTVTYTAAVNASITGVTGAATATGVAGSVTAVRIVSITGVTATATATGIAGSVNTGVAASITGVTGAATADGIAGSVSTVRIVSITGVTATATATGIAGSVTAGVQITITGVTATATADGIAGSATAGIQITVTGVTGTATATGIAGTVSALQIVTVTGITGTATATGIAGLLAISLLGVTATATASGIAGVISFFFNESASVLVDSRAFGSTVLDSESAGSILTDSHPFGSLLADMEPAGSVLADASAFGGKLIDE